MYFLSGSFHSALTDTFMLLYEFIVHSFMSDRPRSLRKKHSSFPTQNFSLRFSAHFTLHFILVILKELGLFIYLDQS